MGQRRASRNGQHTIAAQAIERRGDYVLALRDNTREIGAMISTVTAYYLLSAPLSAEHLGAVASVHWGVENRPHWVLGVVFDEDLSRLRSSARPRNMAGVRRLGHQLSRSLAAAISVTALQAISLHRATDA